MRTKKVVLDYSGFKDDELNTLAGKVLDCLDGHEKFLDLPVSLEDLQVQVTDFRQKWQVASRGGSILERAVKNDAKAVLAESLKDIAFYVNKVAAGSRSQLLSSGLKLEADPKAIGVPDSVTDVGLRDGKQRNQMAIQFKSLGTNYLYEYQITNVVDDQGQAVWGEIFYTSDSRGNVFAPTTPDTTYYLRVRARNKKGAGDWSSVVSLKAR